MKETKGEEKKMEASREGRNNVMEREMRGARQGVSTGQVLPPC